MSPIALNRRTLLTGGTAAAALALAGCTSDDKTGSSTGSLDKVTYMTAFGTFGREGYVYVANAKGYFREAGIDVTVVPGSGQPTDVQAMISGRHQFMAIDSSQAATLMAGGVKNVRWIGAVHQRTVIALMALTKSGITRPADLQGKTVGYGGQAPKLLYGAYSKLAGFDGSTTKWQQVSPQQLPPLLASKKVDAIGQFVMGKPLIKAASGGAEVTVLPYSNFLNDLYGNIFLTTQDTLANKSDLTRRFLGALLKGLSYAVANPDEAGQIINKAVPSTPAAVATAELVLMKPYVTASGPAVGSLDPSRIMRTISLMESVHLIPSGSLTPETVADFNIAPKV
jgi:NitT/TauT family transport system substrate-binding protein